MPFFVAHKCHEIGGVNRFREALERELPRKSLGVDIDFPAWIELGLHIRDFIVCERGNPALTGSTCFGS